MVILQRRLASESPGAQAIVSCDGKRKSLVIITACNSSPAGNNARIMKLADARHRAGVIGGQAYRQQTP